MSQHVAGERPNLSTAGPPKSGHPSRLPDLAGRPRRSGGSTSQRPTLAVRARAADKPQLDQAHAHPPGRWPPALATAGRGTPPPSRRPGGYAGRRAAPMTNAHRAVDEHLRHHPLSALTMEALQLWHSLGLRQLRRPCRPDSANRDVSSVGREAGPAAYRVAPGDPNRSPEPDGVRAPSRTTTVSSGGPDRLRTCTSVV